MNEPRKGETTGYPFRSERMFTIGHEWFFATREGVDQGPFTSREAAESALSAFVHSCQQGRPQFVTQPA